MAERVPQSTAFDVVFKAYLASDHVSAATGKTIAVTISKNKAGFGNPSAGATNATEIASGWYYVNLSTTDTGTLGPLILRGAEGTIDDVGIAYMVIGNPKVDVDTIKTQAVTCGAGVTIRADVGAAGTPGAANGILTTDGTSMNQLLKQGTHTSVVIPTVTAVGTLTTYTGNTLQTGDAFARLGVAGVGLTNIGDTRMANLDAAVTSRLAPAGTLATVTTLTNLPAITTNWLTATGINADAITAAKIADNAIDIATFAADVKTGTYLNAQVKGQDNIAFGALQLASLNAATPASVTGAVGSVTGNVTGSVGSLAAQAKADVNAEVVDALATDTYAEPGQATPGATSSLKDKIGYLFKAWRNRTTQTASTYKLYNDDAATVDQKASFSDDTTTADRGEVATGP